MTLSRNRLATVASLLTMSVLAPASVAQAGTFDGLWSVVAVAQTGACNQYSYTLRVADGRITYAGGGAQASGRVSAQGRISGNLEALGQTISAKGRLAGMRGSGIWSGAGCSGRWQAQKQA